MRRLRGHDYSIRPADTHVADHISDRSHFISCYSFGPSLAIDGEASRCTGEIAHRRSVRAPHRGVGHFSTVPDAIEVLRIVVVLCSSRSRFLVSSRVHGNLSPLYIYSSVSLVLDCSRQLVLMLMRMAVVMTIVMLGKLRALIIPVKMERRGARRRWHALRHRGMVLMICSLRSRTRRWASSSCTSSGEAHKGNGPRRTALVAGLPIFRNCRPPLNQMCHRSPMKRGQLGCLCLRSARRRHHAVQASDYMPSIDSCIVKRRPIASSDVVS